jgi:tetratricopeptide (TPR) repeat protein
MTSVRSRLAALLRAAWARPAWVVFAAAMIPRLVFLFELWARSPTFDAPEGGDSILYDRLASGAAAPLRAYFHAPLYVGFLTAFYRALGRNLFAVRLVQHVLGALACALVAHVARSAFRSRAVALVAGLLGAVLGPVVFYEGMIGVDALMPVLVMGTVALVLHASRRPSARAWGLVGLALGVAALGRAVVLAWMPLLVVWAIAPRRPRWRSAGALLLGAALVIAPVTLRNYEAEGDFTLITANGGLNLYIGNNEAANGAYVLPQGMAFRPGDPADDFEGRRAAEESEGRALTSAEVSAWWSRRAMAFVGASPGRAAQLVLEKAKLLVSHVEYMQLHDYDVYREVAPVLGALPMAGLVTVPGLGGLAAVFVRRGRRPLAQRLAALALVLAASFLPFFVVGRYRTPWLLLLAPFAASWLLRSIAFCRARRWRSLLVPALAAAAAAWAAVLPVPVPSVGFEYMDLARASLARGDHEGAAHWCERAILRDPARTDAAALLGRLRREDGSYAAAEAVLAPAVRRDRLASAAWLELGRVRVDEGRVDQGLDAISASIDADPRSIEGWTALADTLRRAGRADQAEEADRSIARLRRAMDAE